MSILDKAVAKAMGAKRKYKKRAGGKRGPYKKKGVSSMQNTVAGGLNFLTSPSPFPLVWKNCKLRYSDSLIHTVGTSGLFGAETIFALNDLFDPRYSTGGAQPLYRDQIAALYGRYKVYGATVDILYSGPSAPNIACAVMFSPPSTTTALASQTFNWAKEQNNVKVKVLSDTGTQKLRIRKYFPMHQIVQKTKLQYDADIGIYGALSGNSPTDKAYMRVAIADVNLGSSATCAISTTITFHVNWSERIPPARS